MEIKHNDNNTTTVKTEHGQATIPTALYEIFSYCVNDPLVDVVKRASTAGFSNGYVRSLVQTLAQPGQYSGSACIGALATSVQGKRIHLTWGAPAEARPKLTRNK